MEDLLLIKFRHGIPENLIRNNKDGKVRAIDSGAFGNKTHAHCSYTRRTLAQVTRVTVTTTYDDGEPGVNSHTEIGHFNSEDERGPLRSCARQSVSK